MAILLLPSFGWAMRGFNHNENMYLSAAVLLHQSRDLYADFAYVQAPYLPHVYRFAFALLGTDRFMLTAKAVTWVSLVAAALFLFLLATLLADRFLAWTVTALFLLNPLTLFVVSECSNYVLPMATSLAAAWLLLTACREARPGPWRLFASGVLAGASVGLKLYYVSAVAPLVPAALFASARSEATWYGRVRTGLAPMAAGLVVGLAPMAFYMLRSWDVFWFNNLRFHALTTERHLAVGGAESGLRGKWHWVLDQFRELPWETVMVTVVVALCLAGALPALGSLARRCARLARGEAPPTDVPDACASLVPAILTVTTVLGMTPLWHQYLALPVPYLLLLLCWLSRDVGAGHRRAVLAVARVSIAVLLPVSLLGADTVFDRNTWMANRVRTASRAIRAALEERALPGPLATLYPVFALESGLPIYAELATGPFVFAIGDALTPGERERYVATSARDLERLFGRTPPAAILTGFYDTVRFVDETPLTRYARERGYRPVPIPALPLGRKAVLFVRPGR